MLNFTAFSANPVALTSVNPFLSVCHVDCPEAYFRTMENQVQGLTALLDPYSQEALVNNRDLIVDKLNWFSYSYLFLRTGMNKLFNYLFGVTFTHEATEYAIPDQVLHRFWKSFQDGPMEQGIKESVNVNRKFVSVCNSTGMELIESFGEPFEYLPGFKIDTKELPMPNPQADKDAMRKRLNSVERFMRKDNLELLDPNRRIDELNRRPEVSFRR